MKFMTRSILAVIALSTGSLTLVDAFGIRPETKTVKTTTTNAPAKAQQVPWHDVLGKVVCSGLVAASIWSAPMVNLDDGGHMMVQPQNVAVAKEMASASGSRVNKDADSLLRYGLPIKNKEVSVVDIKMADLCIL